MLYKDRLCCIKVIGCVYSLVNIGCLSKGIGVKYRLCLYLGVNIGCAFK